LIINLRDNFELSIDQIQKDLEYFTYPIFQENRNNRPELVASSVAVEIGGSHFLCTASHVLMSLDDNRPTYIANSNLHKKGALVSLRGKAVFTKRVNETDFDLCLFDVTEIKENFNFLSERKITRESKFRQGSLQILLGYPLSKNKVTKTVNPESNVVETGFQTIGVKIDRKIKMSSFVGKNEGIHLGFTYNLDHLKQKLPFPRGMSGGGVWHIPNIYNLNRFYLTGIFIEYHKKEKVGIATKAQYLKSLAEKYV
jgi:hypothetical protein